MKQNLNRTSNQRLITEIQLLQRCQSQWGIPAKPIIDQLVLDSDRPLPDRLPPRPRWTAFNWPVNGSVNYESYWREMDRERGASWTGPYL